MLRRLMLVVCVLATAVAASASAADGSGQPLIKPTPKPGAYDYLTLSMAWSPSFCSSSSGHSDREQCGGTAKYGFIAHGLWPMFPRGSGSTSHGCSMDNSTLTDKSVDKVQGVMPSRKLINHEWEKHGTCFGGDATNYFGKVRTAWDKVKIPQRFKSPSQDSKANADQIRKAFVEANPAMPGNAMAVICNRPRSKAATAEKPLVLKEVRVCLDKSLNFMACGAQVKDRCAGDAIVPAIK